MHASPPVICCAPISGRVSSRSRIGGWDMHSNIYTPNAGLQTLARQFDSGLGALFSDLNQDGLLKETLVIAMGEFGRTVGAPNTQNGRDHFLQQAVLDGGRPDQRQAAIGSTDPAPAPQPSLAGR